MNLGHLCRFGYYLWRHRIPILPQIIQAFIFIVHSSAISYKVKIGKGSFFNHKGFGVLINDNVVIGENCKIGNNVSIVGQGPYKNAPIIKDHVYIGPGAVIQGPVIIENNVIVAPNAVVTKSVPENALVAGIPAKIIGWTNQLDYDIFADESWKEGTKPYME